jgi:hypothetical protein
MDKFIISSFGRLFSNFVIKDILYETILIYFNLNTKAILE